jgi:hypothetical protein
MNKTTDDEIDSLVSSLASESLEEDGDSKVEAMIADTQRDLRSKKTNNPYHTWCAQTVLQQLRQIIGEINQMKAGREYGAVSFDDQGFIDFLHHR